MDVTITTLSLLVSAAVVALLRRDRFARFAVGLVYALWHLPAVLPLIVPVRFPLRESVALPLRYLPLVLLHTIMIPAILLWILPKKTAVTGASVRRAGTLAVLAIAYFGCASVLLDTLVFRTTHTATDLGSRRQVFSSTPPSILGQVGIVAAGAALLLLAIPGGKFPLKVIPFVIVSATFLLVGNRQFFVLGSLVLALTAARRFLPSFRTVLIVGLAVLIVGSAFAVAYGAARQREVAGSMDLMLASLLDLSIDQTALLARGYVLRTTSLYMFLYFGIEFDVAAHVFQHIDTRAPITSVTAPLVYRRLEGLLDLAPAREVASQIDAEIAATAGIYPAVWYTMFGQIFLEAGYFGLLVTTLAAALLHAFLVITYEPGRPAVGLIAFYSLLGFGMMFVPLREGFAIGLVLTLFLYSGINAVWEARCSHDR